MDSGSFDVTLPLNGGEVIRFHYIKELDAAMGVLNTLMEKDCLFSVDTETEALPAYRSYPKAALSPHLSKVRLLQVFDGKNAVVFDMKFIDHYDYFKDFLETKRFIGHNSIFDLQFFIKDFGVDSMNLGCTLLLSKLLMHATKVEDVRLGLGPLSDNLFGVKLYKDMGKTDWSVPDLTYEQIEYGALDTVLTYKIAEKLSHGLSKFKLERIYQLQKAAQLPVAHMQLNGILLDESSHHLNIISWRENLYKATRELKELTGLDRITPHTLADWLEWNLDPRVLDLWPRTETGKLKTDAHVFADFSDLPVVAPFSAYQKAAILCAAFGDTLLGVRNPATRRIHSSFKIGHARTGRMSCSDPNLQQLPRDAAVRKSFIPAPGNMFVCADFSQIELRIAGELSGDKMMQKAYRDGIDLHALTASQVSRAPLDKVTKEERQLAKALNFGLCFGLGVSKFSHYAKKGYNVEVTEQESRRAIEIFRQTYAGYHAWQMQQADMGKNTLRVRTPCGKLRKLEEDNAYGTAMNHPIQGGAAEVMLQALVNFHGRASKRWKLVNCVHDEILVECEAAEALIVKEVLEQEMIRAYLDVFPKGITRGLTDAKIGPTWGDAK